MLQIINLCSNQLKISIAIYLFVMIIYWYLKPSISFNQNGSLKSFGTNSKNNTTIFPFWLISFIVAIISYYLVIFFCIIKKS